MPGGFAQHPPGMARRYHDPAPAYVRPMSVRWPAKSGSARL